MEGDRITIGGRGFVPATDPTGEHHIYLTRHIRAAGLHGLRGLPEAERLALADPVLDRVLESGHTFPILAGLLVPEGQDWTPALASETQQFLRGVRGEEALAQLTDVIVALLLGFFVGPTSSSETTPPTFSTPTPETPDDGASASETPDDDASDGDTSAAST